MHILVDYLTISLHGYTTEGLLRILKIDESAMQEIKSYFAPYGMEKCLYYPKGVKLHCGEYHILELSGQGCRQIETLHGDNFEWLPFLNRFMERENTHISRLDIAADDKAENEKDALLNMANMRRYVETQRYVCKSRKVLIMTGAEEMIIFGSAQSDRRLRIYNKALERGVTGHWIRVEMQLRNDAALSFYMNAWNSNDIGATFGGMLLDYLRFTNDVKNGINTNRLKAVRWWTKFVGTTKRIKGFYLGGVEYNMKGLYNYLTKQTASSYRTYFELNNGSLDALYEIFADAELNKNQLFLIETERRKTHMRMDYKYKKTDKAQELLLLALQNNPPL